MFENMDIWSTLGYAVCFWAVYKLGRLSAYADLYRLARQRGIEILDEHEPANNEPKPMVVDKIGQQYYAYSQGTFLAQATDFRELLEAVKQRFPEDKFRLEKLESSLSDDDAQKLVEAVLNYKSKNHGG